MSSTSSMKSGKRKGVYRPVLNSGHARPPQKESTGGSIHLLRLYGTASAPGHAPEIVNVFDERWNKPTYETETYCFYHGRVACKVPTFVDYRRFYYSLLSLIGNEVVWLDEPVQLLSGAPSATYPQRVTGPVQFLQKLLRTWRLGPAEAVPLLGLEVSDLSVAIRLLGGREPLRGRDVKDRIAYLFRILEDPLRVVSKREGRE